MWVLKFLIKKSVFQMQKVWMGVTLGKKCYPVTQRRFLSLSRYEKWFYCLLRSMRVLSQLKRWDIVVKINNIVRWIVLSINIESPKPDEVYVCVWVYVFVCVFVFVCFCVPCVCVSVCVFVCDCLCVCVCPSLCKAR